MRYPISIQTFATIRNGNYVYVDKTDLVYRLAQEHVCFCRVHVVSVNLCL